VVSCSSSRDNALLEKFSIYSEWTEERNCAASGELLKKVALLLFPIPPNPFQSSSLTPSSPFPFPFLSHFPLYPILSPPLFSSSSSSHQLRTSRRIRTSYQTFNAFIPTQFPKGTFQRSSIHIKRTQKPIGNENKGERNGKEEIERTS